MEEHNRRPSKAELEEDQFLEWVLNAVEYVKARAQLFIGGAVALVAVIVIATFVQSQQVEARSQATALLFKATTADRSGQADRVVGIARKLIDEYGGTPAASHGIILLANRYFALGRYGEAQGLYQRYLDEDGTLEPLVFAARTGLAACLEAQGDHSGAASAYTAFADEHPEHAPSSIVLMDAARCYRLLGDPFRHRATLERVTREYPNTPVAQRAREQLNLLM